MKRIALYAAALLCSGLLWANEPTRGTLKDGVYSYAPLGWTFRVPAGWQVRSAEELGRAKASGLKAFKEEGVSHVDRGDTTLLYMKNDKDGQLNRFSSEASPFDPAVEGEYKQYLNETFTAMENVMRARMDKNGLQVSAKRGSQTIDGVVFTTLTMDLMPKGSEQVVATSYLAEALFGKYTLILSYTASNAAEKAKAHEAILGSKFARK